jgi:hypothetical protein
MKTRQHATGELYHLLYYKALPKQPNRLQLLAAAALEFIVTSAMIGSPVRCV